MASLEIGEKKRTSMLKKKRKRKKNMIRISRIGLSMDGIAVRKKGGKKEVIYPLYAMVDRGIKLADDVWSLSCLTIIVH